MEDVGLAALRLLYLLVTHSDEVMTELQHTDICNNATHLLFNKFILIKFVQTQFHKSWNIVLNVNETECNMLILFDIFNCKQYK